MKVVFIDTGYSSNNIVAKGITINRNKGKYLVSDDFLDDNGHGTKVINLFKKYDSISEFFVVKISTDDEIKIDDLVFSLKYVENNIKCDIIQISSGFLTDNSLLRETIKAITKKSIVVSAFDNDGSISYPAAYEEVIGVDIDSGNYGKNEYVVINENVVDIRVSNMYYRTENVYGKKEIVQGTSYACSYITSLISSMNSILGKEEIKNRLKKQALNVLGFNKRIYKEKMIDLSKTNKAVVFPFNKEVHAIAKNEDRLLFDEIEYYDLKHKFLIGSKICNVLKECDNEKIIHDFDEINWKSDFDLFICSHLKEIEKITKVNYRELIFKKCKANNKKLFCFDDMSDIVRPDKRNENFYYPYYDGSFVPKYRFGKLRKPGIPIIGIYGTSSKQGKYTTQLIIIDILEKSGFKVGFFSSEPNGYLLGADEVLSFGYDSACFLGAELTMVANEMIWKIEKKCVDIIVSASQSGTLSYDNINMGMMTYNQLYYLNGTNPDSIILCINAYDSLNYIERTIDFLSAITEGTIIFCIINDLNKGENEEINKYRIINYLKKNNIPSFSLENMDRMAIRSIILNYYS